MALLEIVKASSRKGRARIERLAQRGDEVVSRKVLQSAARIVEGVRRGGDKGLLEAVRRLDGVRVRGVAELRYSGESLPSNSPKLPVGFVEGLERSIAAVERYHRRQIHSGFTLEDGGMRVEERRTPLDRVGVYVPGGRAAYPSTVVMTVVPARLAGVRDIAVATPWKSLQNSPALQYTLQRLRVDEVWGIGGAQAIAALAYGTESIDRVDKIVGPGNAWVTAAKQLVSRSVGVESLAGPSEVVVLATKDSSAEWIAADLLAQAEHDPLAAAVLVTPSRALGKAVAAEVGQQLKKLPQDSAAKQSLARFGTVFIVEDIEAGFHLVNEIAPEHLQLVGKAAEVLAERTLVAGAVFVGAATPEVFGDYVAGPSHVLPTCGGARYASALGVDDFIRRWHIVQCAPGAASRWASAAVALAEAEGLPAHAAAALRRVR
jgi:histidinol dehydrogenase